MCVRVAALHQRISLVTRMGKRGYICMNMILYRNSEPHTLLHGPHVYMNLPRQYGSTGHVDASPSRRTQPAHHVFEQSILSKRITHRERPRPAPKPQRLPACGDAPTWFCGMQGPCGSPTVRHEQHFRSPKGAMWRAGNEFERVLSIGRAAAEATKCVGFGEGLGGLRKLWTVEGMGTGLEVRKLNALVGAGFAELRLGWVVRWRWCVAFVEVWFRVDLSDVER